MKENLFNLERRFDNSYLGGHLSWRLKEPNINYLRGENTNILELSKNHWANVGELINIARNNFLYLHTHNKVSTFGDRKDAYINLMEEELVTLIRAHAKAILRTFASQDALDILQLTYDLKGDILIKYLKSQTLIDMQDRVLSDLYNYYGYHYMRSEIPLQYMTELYSHVYRLLIFMSIYEHTMSQWATKSINVIEEKMFGDITWYAEVVNEALDDYSYYRNSNFKGIPFIDLYNINAPQPYERRFREMELLWMKDGCKYALTTLKKTSERDTVNVKKTEIKEENK